MIKTLATWILMALMLIAFVQICCSGSGCNRQPQPSPAPSPTAEPLLSSLTSKTSPTLPPIPDLEKEIQREQSRLKDINWRPAGIAKDKL